MAALAFVGTFVVACVVLGGILWKLEQVTRRKEKAARILEERGWGSIGGPNRVIQARDALRWIERQLMRDEYVRDLSDEDREEGERILRGGQPRELG
jgi:hypothetical protein